MKNKLIIIRNKNEVKFLIKRRLFFVWWTINFIPIIFSKYENEEDKNSRIENFISLIKSYYEDKNMEVIKNDS